MSSDETSSESHSLSSGSTNKKFVRKPVVIRRESNITSASALQKLHDESERRLSRRSSDDYEKFRRATVRIDNPSELESLRGLVLEKARQTSISVKKPDVAATSRSIASRFDDVSDSDLLNESINVVINRLGQGNEHFENGDLFEYIRLVFKKSKFEMGNQINLLKEKNESAHTLQIMLERANLKRAPKSSAFCSMTLKRSHEVAHFSMCNENNTVMSTLCGSQSPLWDVTLSLPLETTKGYSLVVAIWETRTNVSMATVNEGKKCMGVVEIDLDSQQNTESGNHQWWELNSAKKPNKQGKKNGRVHLGIRYNAEVGQHSNAVMVHAGMLSKFLSIDYPKSGGLSGLAAHILELQKRQQRLTSDEFRFVDWLVRVELYANTNSNYELLHRVLSLLLDCVNKTNPCLSDEYLSRLWGTFTEFQTIYIKKMNNLNGEFPFTSETSVIDLKYFTKCYLDIVNCRPYAERHAPAIKQGKLELADSFKANAIRWITSITKPFTAVEDDTLRQRTKKASDMATAVRIEMKHESTSYVPNLDGTPYSTTVIYQVNEKISNVVVEIIGMVIAHLKATDCQGMEDEDLLNDSLSLYVAVANLKKLCGDLLPDTQHALNHFHSWFYSIIETWMAMVQVKQRVRVAKSVEFDELSRMDMHITYSSSVMDVDTMNTHLCEIQDMFDFPDEASRYSVISKLTRQALESEVQLAETLFKKGKTTLERGSKKFGEQKLTYDESLRKSLVVACSLEKAGSNLQFLAGQLSWEKLSQELIHKLAAKRNEAFDTILKYKVTWMVWLCETLIEPKFVSAFTDFIQLLNSREKDAVEELLKMLEEDLNMISSNTDPDLFDGFLKITWERVVLPQFHRHIDTKPNKIKNYYDILQESFIEVSDFFVAAMMSRGHLITQNHDYKKLLYILDNLTIPIEELLFRYFVEEMVQQSQQDSDLGFLKFTAALTRQQDKTLVRVTVISCAGLPIMDTIGKCDAMVKVALQPRHTPLFSHIKVLKTKPIYNDLDPVFNQEFSFSFYCDLDELNDGACLQFTVWDKDLYSKDDFIGEVLLSISEIPFDNPQEYKMPLVLPDLKSLSYDAIQHRGPYEKSAQKFFKERSTVVAKGGNSGDEFIKDQGSTFRKFENLLERIQDRHIRGISRHLDNLTG